MLGKDPDQMNGWETVIKVFKTEDVDITVLLLLTYGIRATVIKSLLFQKRCEKVPLKLLTRKHLWIDHVVTSLFMQGVVAAVFHQTEIKDLKAREVHQANEALTLNGMTPLLTEKGQVIFATTRAWQWGKETATVIPLEEGAAIDCLMRRGMLNGPAAEERVISAGPWCYTNRESICHHLQEADLGRKDWSVPHWKRETKALLMNQTNHLAQAHHLSLPLLQKEGIGNGTSVRIKSRHKTLRQLKRVS